MLKGTRCFITKILKASRQRGISIYDMFIIIFTKIISQNVNLHSDIIRKV